MVSSAFVAGPALPGRCCGLFGSSTAVAPSRCDTRCRRSLRQRAVVAVATSPQQKSATQTSDPLAQRPPFRLEDVRKAIPAKLWKKDTKRSMGYLIRDVAVVGALAYAAITINNPLVWLLYYFAQGTMMWALFVVGHDCGHGSFSPNRTLNNIFGHISHGSILVPFHGWRISHRTHHSNHGHVENDESWYPLSRSMYDSQDALTKLIRYELPMFLFAYQIYLFKRTPGKEGSHFDPKCDLFRPNERNEVVQSSAVCIAMVALLAALGWNFGFLFVLNTYLIPHTIFCAWLVIVTYLHHTDASVPWYRDGEWSYLRGGLSTVDKDYGIFNRIHHDIGTHVVHHLFPQIPHYNIVEATEHIKPVLGEYYRKPKSSGWFPFHLVTNLVKSSRECHFVKDDGTIVYYER